MDYMESIKTAFRDKRMIVREFEYDGSKAGGLDGQIEQAKNELKLIKQSVIRWCRTHYGEVYNGWIHLKVIRAFVESVLRYGLPVNNLSFFVQSDGRYEKELRNTLMNSILNLRAELKVKKMEGIDDAEMEEDENLPFVCQRFTATAASLL